MLPPPPDFAGAVTVSVTEVVGDAPAVLAQANV
jgi:hypothetical protein